MIPAATVPAFRRWFTWQARSRIAARFGRMQVLGLEAAIAVCKDRPALIVANHSAWWDGLVALVLTEQLGADGIALMDAENLRKTPFFRLVGGCGVDRSVPTDGAMALRYCARHLRTPGTVAWVFPQGEERPDDPRPLGFHAGSASIAAMVPTAAVLPVGIRYVFAGRETPDLWVSFGAPVPAERDVQLGRRRQEQAVEAELQRLDQAILDDAGGLALLPTVQAGTSPAERVLSWMSSAWLRRRDRV